MNKKTIKGSKFIIGMDLQNVNSTNFGPICIMLIFNTIYPDKNYLDYNVIDKILKDVMYLNFYADSELIAKFPKHFLLPGLEDLRLEEWLNHLVYPLVVGHSQLIIIITAEAA
jgi:hypothetical protein